MKLTSLASLAALLAASLPWQSYAASPQEPPVLFELKSGDINLLKTENGAVVTQEGDGLKLAFSKAGGYPGVDIPPQDGEWDLSAFSGVEAEVTNAGTTKGGFGMRVENKGDWKQSPWNSETLWLEPGAKGKIRVTFGMSHGNPAYELDASKVSKIKLMATEPKGEGAFAITSLKPVGTASPAAAASAPATTAPAATAPAQASSKEPKVIFDGAASPDIAALKTEKATVELEDNKLKLVFPAAGGYPGVDFRNGNATYDLSAYNGVEVKVINPNSFKVGVGLRVDNPGDWKKSPWNSETVWLSPGQAATIPVTFGMSFGKPGYALDASKVSNIKVMVSEPAQAGELLIEKITAVGTAQAGRSVAAASTDSAAAPGAPLTPSTSSPAISGELIFLDKAPDLGTFRTSKSNVAIEDYKGAKALRVNLDGGGGYPNVNFPIPKGGWNLDAFGGVKAKVTNVGDTPVRAALRVDNPGHWKDQPWNTTLTNIKPGETQVIEVIFGKNGTAPGFPLNPVHVSGIQLFGENPKNPVSLVVEDLRAFGSAEDRVDKNSFTKPEDRNIPVTPPEWLGKRPPVEGDWVQTLDENFDGNAIDAKLWTPRFPWDGPQPGQLQRYAPENVTVENGVAKFKSEKKHGHENNDPSRPTREYTSGLIQSYDKWSQAYGYFEARIKLPTARGLWPAFWMMPDRGGESGLDMWRRRDTANKGMEIDILEHLAEWGPGRNNVAVHWDGYGDNHKSWGTSNIYFGPTPDGWHNFGVLWEPGKLTWFIDGKKVVEWENERVSSVPSYLKLNIQMGGWATKDVDLSKLPDVMEVDYVRAWQLRDRVKN